jgi:hypothetical protein
LGVSRKVVRKVIRPGATEFRYQREDQPLPKIGRWRDRLDQLLAQNETKSSRERLTLIRLFEELRGRGYDGGYDAVRDEARFGSDEPAAVVLAPRGIRPQVASQLIREYIYLYVQSSVGWNLHLFDADLEHDLLPKLPQCLVAKICEAGNPFGARRRTKSSLR